MVSEIHVTVRNDERKLTQKYLVYEAVTTADDDPVIKGCIDNAIKSFNGEHDCVRVKIHLQVA